MKLKLTFLICCFLAVASLHAQLEFSGTYLVGDAQPVYKKLSDVAAALNNPDNTVTGDVVFELDSDYDGTTGETFPITFNQFNNPLLSTVTIRPKNGVSMRMTAGDPGTNNALILLDGADYLQLDGRAGGEGSTISWTIRNKRTAASIGSAIRLQNDATMNRLDYLQLEANPTDASQAVVVLGSTNGSQGNDNNVVSYCNIRNRSDLSASSTGAGNMVAGILSANTTVVESSFNSGNGFYSNNIFNFYCVADSSFGVNLWSGTTNTTISNNSFYRTNDLTVFGGETFQCAIFVREQLSLGWNIITGNYIGGKAPQTTGGRFSLFATLYKFEGITITSPVQLTTGEANQVYANTIRLIQISATGHSSGETFCGIKIRNSASYTINNTIGRPDGYESIIVTSSGANTTFTCKGIDYKGLPQSISYNKIGGLKLSASTGTIAGGFTAINLVDSTASGEFAITDNQIGGNAGYPKSIESSAPATATFQVRGIALANEYSSVYCRGNAISGIQNGNFTIPTVPQSLSGIVKTGNGPASILYNTVAELVSSSAAADTSITFPAFTGISVLQGTNNAIGYNSIRQLRSVYFSQSAGSAGLAGILVSENASASVYNNYLYGFNSTNLYTSFTAVLMGILARGSATISNNTLSFSNISAETGTNDLYNCVITGIVAGAPAATTLNVYHNSIYIGGDNGDGNNTGWSAPVSLLTSSGATLRLRNNVLVNERTGGTAAHYIFYNAASSPAASWPVTVSDYNLLVALYPDRFGRWGSSNLDSTQWKANGGDTHSTFTTISQIAPSDLFTDKFTELAIQQSAQHYVAGKGTTGTGITEDITEAIRSTTAPSLGAYEYAVLEFTSYSGADSATVSVAENQTLVTTLAATSSNAAATITYSLVGTDDDSYFTIDGATGELSFATAPDFEQPSDADGDNVYLVTVQATDGTRTAVQVLTVTVTDVNEVLPGITLFQEDFDNITGAFPAGWTLADVDQMVPSQYIIDLFPNAWNRLPKTSMYPDDPETDTCAWTTSWFDNGSNDPADDWMWTPGIDLSGSNIQLSWKAKGFAAYEVRVMTTAPTGSTGNMGNMLSSAVLFSRTLQDYTGMPNLTGVVHSADLSAYSGQKVYIGFRYITEAGDYVFGIDDVTVKTNFAITSTHTDTVFRNTDAISVAENTTAVTTVAATDETGGSVSYSITGGADAAKFSINNSTGELAFVTAPDFETPGDAGGDNKYELTVQATNGTLTDVQAITVTVTDVYEAPPAGITLFKEDFGTPYDPYPGVYNFPSGWIRANVDNLTPAPGIEVMSEAWMAIEDPDNQATNICAWSNSHYQDGNTADDWMWTPAIDLSGSAIRLNWRARRYYSGDPNSNYEVRIMTAVPTGSTGNMGNMLSSTVLSSIADEDYAWSSHTADLSAYSGQRVYIGFRNNSTTGNILMVDDVEVKTNFAITSTHTDTLFRNTDTINVAENATAVGTVAATNEAGGTVSYSITGGADAAKFSINNNTGALSFVTAPDFEAPGDAGANNVYEVTVQATNGTLTDVQAITVTVTDVADAAVLAITSYSGAASASVNVAENQTLVTTVTATYSDPAVTIAYSLVGTDDDTYFTVDGATGKLSFVNAPDFDRPSDPDENNMYMVTVQASAGSLTATQRFKVRVTNVNDIAPEFGSFDGDASVTLRLPENTQTVGTVWAVDREPGTTITYSIAAGNEGALFSVNPITGALRFITAPDYENPQDQYAGNTYIVTVQASDGELVSLQRFKIKVTDVNEGTGRMSNNTTGMAQATGEMQSGKGIGIFPNPVTGKRFTLRVTDLAAGNYTLELYTANGQLAYRQTLNHTSKSTSYPIQLPATHTKGVYVLKLAGGGTIHSEKLVIE